MRFRFTLFLLVANLAVFGLIWNNARERNREQPPAELVFPVNADRITLAASDPEEGSYTLVQKTGRWSLKAPFEWPANGWIAQKILDSLRFVSRDGGFTLESVRQYGNTLESYGLDKPRYALTVSAGGVDTAVKIGRLTPNGEGVYLLSPDGASVLLAPTSLLTALRHKPEELRQPEVFSVQPFEVRSVALTIRDGAQETRIGLVREKRGSAGENADQDFSWRFETPISSEADTPNVDKHLAALGEMKFRRFLSSSPELLEKTGLAAPVLRLSLEGNNRRQTLLVGGPDADDKSGTRYAKFDDNPAVFTIPAGALDPWVDMRREMREHRFMRFDVTQLTGITVHEGQRSLVLHRIDSSAAAGGRPEWQMPVVPGSTATTVTPVDPDILDRLQNSLANLRAREFLTDDPTPAELKAKGLDAPAKRVELAFRDGSKRELVIAAPVAKGGSFHARIDNSTTIFTISPAVPELLSVAPEAYRRRTLFSMPVGARLVSVKITDIASGKALLDEKKPDDVVSWATWLESRPKKEREDLLLLGERLRTLSAASFISRPFSDNYTYDAKDGAAPVGWRYKLEWVVSLPAGAEGARTETHTLVLTRRLGGSEQIAGLAAEGVVFVLDQDWIDALQPVLFGRDSAKDLPEIPAPTPAQAPPAAK